MSTDRTDELEGLLSALVLVSNRLVRLAVHAIGDTEPPTRWRTLSVLETHGPLRLGELAERSRVSQPTMTKAIARLEPQGHVERVADPTDARATLLRVTPAGSQALAQWCTRLSRALLPYFDTATDHELDALGDTVTLLADRLEHGIAHEEPPTPTHQERQS